MKLLRITDFYPEYLRYFYSNNDVKESYIEQYSFIMNDRFAWSDVWPCVLKNSDVECEEIILNDHKLQNLWAKENNPSLLNNFKMIVLSQALKFNPDILWFDSFDLDTLKILKSKLPNLNLVMGWSGSAIYKSKFWSEVDLVLSCAPEACEYFNNNGHKSIHFNHAFDSRILNNLIKENESGLSFVGQIVRANEFHLLREELLLNIIKSNKLNIYSESFNIGYKKEIKNLIRTFINGNFPYRRLVNPKLKDSLKSPLYGLNMYRALLSSEMVLNIHADSSPVYASNMRLFETTGVGACLVTDFRQNLKEFFELDDEVVVFRNLDECLEKVKWLNENPQKRIEIARKGQLKTLKMHTFENRKELLLKIIKQNLK